MFNQIKLLYLCLVVFGLWPSSALSQIQVTDDLGNSVMLARHAQRIIALAPHLVENVYSAGLGDALVGAVDYSDYPEQALQLPRVGNSSTLNLESIVALKPDLILAWSGANKPAELHRLQALGIPVYVDNAHDFARIARSLINFGKLGDSEKTAQAAADKFIAQQQQLEQRYKQQEKLRVFYQVWNNPIQSLNHSTLMHQIITLCGGINIAAEATAVAPIMSIEAVIQADPELIFTGDKHQQTTSLDIWRNFDTMTAVKNQQLFAINPDLTHRHSVRVLQGAELMCAYMQNYRKQKSEAK